MSADAERADSGCRILFSNIARKLVITDNNLDTGSCFFYLSKWVTHASLIWELHEKELSKLADDRREREKRHARSLALLTKQLTEERERVCTAATNEREAAAVQLRAAQEVSITTMDEEHG